MLSWVEWFTCECQYSMGGRLCLHHVIGIAWILMMGPSQRVKKNHAGRTQLQSPGRLASAPTHSGSCWISPDTADCLIFFSVTTGTSAAAGTRSICPVPFPYASSQSTHQPSLPLLVSRTRCIWSRGRRHPHPTARRRWTTDSPGTVLNKSVTTNDGLI